jgi:hypothetical protein
VALLITNQIFQDGASYRSRLKALAANLVAVHYKTELEPEINYPHNELEYWELVSRNVDALLKNGMFLRGATHDENVRSDILESSQLIYSVGKNSKFRPCLHRRSVPEMVLQGSKLTSFSFP